MNEILFEFRRVGNSIRVSAIDPATNTEVVTIAPLGASETTMKTNAARKLRYVLEKKSGGSGGT